MGLFLDDIADKNTDYLELSIIGYLQPTNFRKLGSNRSITKQADIIQYPWAGTLAPSQIGPSVLDLAAPEFDNEAFAADE